MNTELENRNDIENEEDTQKVLMEKGKKYIRKHWPMLLGVLVVLSLVVQTARLGSAKAAQAEMEERIGLLSEVVEKLTKENNDQADFIKDNLPVITSETLKEKLAPAADLVTEQYNYHNADKLEQDQSWLFGWKRPFSSKSILVTYDGVIKAGVDLSGVMPVVDEENRTITVTLPPSQITDNNIPQETITVVEIKNGLFNKVTVTDYNNFIAEQKVVMEEKAIAQGLLDEADKNAEEIVKSLLSVVPGVSLTPQEGYYTLVIE